jgi:hypothetical protein
MEVTLRHKQQNFNKIPAAEMNILRSGQEIWRIR